MTNTNNQKLIRFPATIAVKVIIANDDVIQNEITQIVLASFPKFETSLIKKQVSANSSFLSLTYPIYVKSKKPIEKLYQMLSTNPNIKMVL